MLEALMAPRIERCNLESQKHLPRNRPSAFARKIWKMVPRLERKMIVTIVREVPTIGACQTAQSFQETREVLGLTKLKARGVSTADDGT